MRQGAHQMRDLEPLFPLAFLFRDGILFGQLPASRLPWENCQSLASHDLHGGFEKSWVTPGWCVWALFSNKTKHLQCYTSHYLYLWNLLSTCEGKNFPKIWVQTSSVWRSCDFTKNLFHGVQDGPGTRAWYLIVGESMREHHVHSVDAFSDL